MSLLWLETDKRNWFCSKCSFCTLFWCYNHESEIEQKPLNITGLEPKKQPHSLEWHNSTITKLCYPVAVTSHAAPVNSKHVVTQVVAVLTCHFKKTYVLQIKRSPTTTSPDSVWVANGDELHHSQPLPKSRRRSWHLRSYPV